MNNLFVAPDLSNEECIATGKPHSFFRKGINPKQFDGFLLIDIACNDCQCEYVDIISSDIAPVRTCKLSDFLKERMEARYGL